VTSKDADAASRLAARAGRGDQSALAALIRLTQRDVWRYLAGQVGAGEADDLTQETYLRAIATLPRFEGRSSIRTWLLVIARRVVIDDIRRKMVRPRTVSGDGWQDLAETAQGRNRLGGSGTGPTDLVDIELLLADLSPERREALVLTQVLGLSYQEAAAICGCPIGTVRSRVARGREDLLAATRPNQVDGRAASS